MKKEVSVEKFYFKEFQVWATSLEEAQRTGKKR
jgi:hypothetical protein